MELWIRETMKRRDALRFLVAASLPGALSACGGGSTSATAAPKILQLTADKDAYFIGEAARITAVFSGGVGRLEPGALPIVSGIPVTTPPLSATTTMRLLLTSNGDTDFRDITLEARYRNTFKSMPMGFQRASHTTAEGDDGRVYIFGGESGESTAPLSVYAFNPFTETFAMAGAVLTGRTLHTSTTLEDGSVLLFGGARSISGSPFSERFYPRTGTSKATASQPLKNRTSHSATLLADGRVVLMGGMVSGETIASPSVDLYEPATDRFTRLAVSLNVGRSGHTATRIGANKVLVYGGVTHLGQFAPPELFDTETQSFTLIPPLLTETADRIGHLAVRTTANEVLIVGGETYADGTPFRTLVRASQRDATLREAGPMNVPRAALAAAPLANGSVLICGGTSAAATTPTNSSEIYLPSSGTTVAGPMMSVGRVYHTANLLVTGKVLIVGGNNQTHGLTDSAELFS